MMRPRTRVPPASATRIWHTTGHGSDAEPMSYEVMLRMPSSMRSGIRKSILPIAGQTLAASAAWSCGHSRQPPCVGRVINEKTNGRLPDRDREKLSEAASQLQLDRLALVARGVGEAGEVVQPRSKAVDVRGSFRGRGDGKRRADLDHDPERVRGRRSREAFAHAGEERKVPGGHVKAW